MNQEDQVKIDISGEIPTFETKQNQFSFTQLSQLSFNPKEFIETQKRNVRPWNVFVQTSNFRTPVSLIRLNRRLFKNLDYFQSNYLFVFAGLFVYCLITSPFVLVAIIASAYLGYKLSRRSNFAVFGRDLNVRQRYLLVGVVSVPVFYLAGVHGAVFWVLGVSFFVILLHATFYNIDGLATSEEELFVTQDV